MEDVSFLQIKGQMFYTVFWSVFFLFESCTINYKTTCWFHATVQLYYYTTVYMEPDFEDDTQYRDNSL